MNIIIRVFIPESGTKTQLIYDDLQRVREWVMKNSSPENSVIIYKTKNTNTQCIFLKETLMTFGAWKNIRIH